MTQGLLFAIVDTISILFLGDIMQHREQLSNALIPGADTAVHASYDYSSYFEHIGHIIEEADFTVANMEFCLGGAPYSGYPAFSAPESLAGECAEAGIDLFLCANNHILDRGRRGLQRSFDAYDDIGIPYTGIHRDREDEVRDNPFMAETGGIRVAFINFTYGTNGIPTPSPYIVSKMDRQAVSAAICRAKERGADIIIALPHWGIEYELEPSDEQRDWQRFLYSQGVDAIIGTHPHVIQPVETTPNSDHYHDSGSSPAFFSINHSETVPYGSHCSIRVTAFSLGNLISNMSRHDTELGLAFRLDIGITASGMASVIGFEAIPLWSARPGKFHDRFTILPIEDFIGKPHLFRDIWNYRKMAATYERLLPLF